LLTACSSTSNLPTSEIQSTIKLNSGDPAADIVETSQPPLLGVTQTPIQLSTMAPDLPTPEPLEAHSTPSAEVFVATPERTGPTCQQPELFRSGRLCYTSQPPNRDIFIHPISMVSNGRLIWLIDGGRVLQIDLENPDDPAVLLAPGEMIADEPVQEPIDLALIDLDNGEAGLLVLDRVGDVYLFDFGTKSWSRDRYSRPIGTTSSHYYLALATNGTDRFLLEASYRYGIRYLPNHDETGWSVDPESVLVDLAVSRDSDASFAYVLQRPIDSPQAEIIRYVQGQIDGNFRPTINITQPREIQVGPRAIYLLDQAGLRLSVLNNENGTLLSQTEFPFPISTFALYLDQFGSSHAIYAGKNTLYLPGEPDTQVTIDLDSRSSLIVTNNAYGPQIWANVPDLILPIENLPPDSRELRLPGAPRHYRQGIHEGMDFYWGPGRQIRAVAAGTIIRIDWDYVEPWPELFTFYRSEAAELGKTSEEGLDFFRGRQIWIQHENGFISRHAHLSTMDPNLNVGSQVAQGEIIGRVGNSGSPGSLDGPEVDSHLHFELWYADQGYLGQYLRPIETRELIETIFTTP